MEPYFVLPASDDPWTSLAAIGIRGRSWWQGLLTTAPAMIAVINSVLAGVVAGLVARSVARSTGPLLPAVSAAAGFVVSLVLLGLYEQRVFQRDMAAAPVAFPRTAPTSDTIPD
jgi:hypothetical protein